jgi:hypothetical protein
VGSWGRVALAKFEEGTRIHRLARISIEYAFPSQSYLRSATCHRRRRHACRRERLPETLAAPS